MLFAMVLGDWIALVVCFVGWWVTICQYDPDKTGKHQTAEDGAMVFFGTTAFWLFMLWAISKYWVHWVPRPFL